MTPEISVSLSCSSILNLPRLAMMGVIMMAMMTTTMTTTIVMMTTTTMMTIMEMAMTAKEAWTLCVTWEQMKTYM